MGQGTYNNPAQDAETQYLATRRLTGARIHELADELGVNKSSISRRLSKPEIKAWIEAKAQELALECTQDIIDNHKTTIRAARKILERSQNQTRIKIHLKQPTQQSDNQVDTVNQVNSYTEELEALSDSDKIILALADKKEHRIGQSIGIFPSQSPSLVINNLFDIQSTLVLAPAVAQLLGGQLRMKQVGSDQGDVIDVLGCEIEDEEE